MVAADPVLQMFALFMMHGFKCPVCARCFACAWEDYAGCTRPGTDFEDKQPRGCAPLYSALRQAGLRPAGLVQQDGAGVRPARHRVRKKRED